MSLDTLLSRVRGSIEDELATVEEETQEQVEAIQRETDEEIAALRREANEQTAREVERQRRRVLEEARFKALQIEGSARERLVSRVLEAVGEKLGEARAEPEYGEILSSLTQQAIEAVHMEPMVVHGDRRDEELLEGLKSEPGLADIIFDLETWGGVVAEGGNRKAVTVDNTLESRLEQARENIRDWTLDWLQREEKEVVG